jgi:serine/threonine protein kinase
MGTVYLAHGDRLDRDVALKVPCLDGDPRHVERFRREARLAANIHHPNICPVFDVGCEDGIHYLTMPLLRGESLSALIKREGALPAPRAAALAARVASALAAAHREGIIHRDLKPANIMVDERLEPVVVDFGLARNKEVDEPGVTILGDVIGTPAYVAPEQACGDPVVLGPSCDIYSLGVVLYELLTGRAPFEGNTPLAIFKQVLTQDPDPPSRHRPDVDPRLEAICLTSMARDPQARYRSMDALVTALESWLKNPDGDDAPARPTPQKRVTRRQWTIVLGAIALAVVGLIVAALPRPSPTQQPAATPLTAGSRWTGMFRFRPPIRNSVGDVQLRITERQGDTFRGIYETEHQIYCWQMEGTVRRDAVRWNLTKAIRGPGAEGAAGNAHIEGRIVEDGIEAVYRDSDSVADLFLHREK